MSKNYLKYLSYFFLLMPVLMLIIILNYDAMVINVNAKAIAIIALFWIFIYIANRYKQEINNPINLFVIGWIIPLTLSQIRMSYRQTDFSSDTWMLIILTTFSFIIPICLNQGKIIKVVSGEHYDFEKIYPTIKFLYFMSVIFIIANWVVQGGIPLISGQYTVGHLDFAKGFNYFINILSLTSGLAVLHLGMTKKNKFFHIIIMLTPYIYSILQTQRSVMFMALYYEVMFAYIVLKLKNVDLSKIKEIVIKRMVIFMCIFLVFMNLIGNIRLSATSSEGSYWAQQLNFKGESNIVAWVYSYYPMNFDNLNKFITDFDGNYSYGYNVLMPIIGPTQLKSLWKDKLISYNTLWLGATGTYLMKIYGDGGMLFTIIIVFLIGVLISVIYRKFIRYGDIKWYGVYSIFSFGIIYMFFDSGALFDPTVILYSIIVYLTLKKAEITKA